MLFTYIIVLPGGSVSQRLECECKISDCLLIGLVLYGTIKIQKTKILHIVLCECETWHFASLLRVLGNRVIRIIFGLERGEGNCTLRSSIICTLRQILR
jgi:hypothetical protein